MNVLLALDCATDACSIALQVGHTIVDDHRLIPQQHAQQILPMIDTLLASAGVQATQLDGVVFGQGPGSFTGVRIAAAITQGIALGADGGVLGISTLQVMAQGCWREFQDRQVGVALDARMDEVYWGLYTFDDALHCMRSCVADTVCLPALIQVEESVVESGVEPVVEPVEIDTQLVKPIGLCGSGAERYSEQLRTAIGLQTGQQQVVVRQAVWPQARDLLAIAQQIASPADWQSAEAAIPVYLRNRVALTEAQRAQGEVLRK